MKNFKGLYYNDKTKTPSFEHGAHFKYNDLVNALNELLSTNKNDFQNLETDYSSYKNNLLLVSTKKNKSKKYKLKLLTENIDNQRIEDTNNLYENNNKNKKVSLSLSKTIDRNEIKLPNIKRNINNNSLTLKNKSYNSNRLFEEIIADEEKNSFNINELKNKPIEIKNTKLFYYKRNHHNYDKEKILPKINSFYYNQIEKENENKKNNINVITELQSDIKEKKVNKLNMSEEENDTKNNSHKKNNYKKKYKLFINNEYNNNIINSENTKIKGVVNDRLKSIFEIEKNLKLNKLLNNRNKSNTRKYIEKIDDNINNRYKYIN